MIKLEHLIEIMSNYFEAKNTKEIIESLNSIDYDDENGNVSYEKFEEIIKLRRKEYQNCVDHCTLIERLMKLQASPTFDK